MAGWVAVCLAGCSPVEPKPSPKTPEEPTQSSDVEVGSSKKTTLIGVLHEGGTRVCTEPYEVHWVERTWAVGFVPLVHSADELEAIAKLEGAVVKVVGVVTDEPSTVHEGDPRPEKNVMCGQMQMRSDWEPWPKGIRVRRGDGPDLTGLRMESIEVVKPLSGTLHDDEVWFKVSNPLERDLQDATLVAHYEGCYGKPGSTVQRRPLGMIPTGAVLEDIPVPQISMREMARGSEHRLDSVQLTATVEGAALDLDVDISSLGLEVSCPERT